MRPGFRTLAFYAPAIALFTAAIVLLLWGLYSPHPACDCPHECNCPQANPPGWGDAETVLFLFAGFYAFFVAVLKPYLLDRPASRN